MTGNSKPTCTAYIENEYSNGRHQCTLQAGHRDDPEIGDYHAAPDVQGRYCWSDAAVGAVPHREVAAAAVTEAAATEATELDKSLRYLRPVAAMPISEDPNGVHLAVYEWMPRVEAWATGPGLCGESMKQGALPEGTVVTCARCLEWQHKYERYLDPGYRPEDDDAEVLRRRAETAEREVAAARKFAAEMRDFCSPHGVATDYADRLVRAMDRAKEGPA